MVKQQTRDESVNVQVTPNLTPTQQVLQDLWEAHLQSEIATHQSRTSATDGGCSGGSCGVYWLFANYQQSVVGS
ncbi:hypothetical protein WA1_24310 [Scytonema hofmannii PCC 7110]|uniref:Uncharacterized protein n=1 Tax=Scytonema hofmannii PCC 7110 TaxID=128403 RepID=A0A139X803_9CYAN|nr:hypothetical protein [Scytonema hofmannii]KYC40762.1 hypothetical protein WA1_24310 [Scytonema hofmannii PCC 7110]